MEAHFCCSGKISLRLGHRYVVSLRTLGLLLHHVDAAGIAFEVKLSDIHERSPPEPMLVPNLLVFSLLDHLLEWLDGFFGVHGGRDDASIHHVDLVQKLRS